MTETAWHIVHCVARSDGGVKDWLARLKVPFYYPMVREMRRVPNRQLSKRHRGRGLKRPHLVPLLPRYVFVRFDMGTPGWRETLDIAGVRGLVCAGDLPVRIDDAEIEAIRMREVDGAVPGKTPLGRIVRAGDTVRIGGGPLEGHEAVVDRAIEDVDSDTRIRVMIDILGGATPVDLDIGLVELV